MSSTHAMLLSAALSIASLGCGTTSTADLDDRPAALLLATDAYELHYRDGRVLMLDQRPGASKEPHEVETYEEFKELYEVRKDTALPDEQPTRGVGVDGFRGLDCVRKGLACGRAPEEPTAGILIHLELLFPQSAQ